MLGIRSVNTLKALVRTEGIETVMHGNRMMIPLSEVERIREQCAVRGIHAADRAHEAAENLGAKEGLTQEEMDALSAGRPGTPPWRHEVATHRPAPLRIAWWDEVVVRRSSEWRSRRGGRHEFPRAAWNAPGPAGKCPAWYFHGYLVALDCRGTHTGAHLAMA